MRFRKYALISPQSIKSRSLLNMHMVKRGAWLHHRISQSILNFHRLRKHPEKGRADWKHRWNEFNESQLGWLEDFVDRMIPWLIFLLLLILLGEFSHELNFFGWSWMEEVALFFVRNHDAVDFFDNIIVALIIVDLYFNFFKKRTVWMFLRTSIIDIMAIAPLGEIFRLTGIGAGVGEVQSALHVGSQLESEAAKIVRGEELAMKVTKEARIARAVSRMPRFIQLSRFVSKKGHKSKWRV